MSQHKININMNWLYWLVAGIPVILKGCGIINCAWWMATLLLWLPFAVVVATLVFFMVVATGFMVVAAGALFLGWLVTVLDR
jgi:hypothetical protein